MMPPELLDILSVVATVGIFGLLVLSARWDRRWWRQLWGWLSGTLEPVRQLHWTLPPLLVLVALTGMGWVAYQTVSIPFMSLWALLLWLSVGWFFKGRLRSMWYRRGLEADLPIKMEVVDTSGKFSRITPLLGCVRLPQLSIGIMGATRSGKTEAAKHLVQQMVVEPDAFVPMYEHKDDYTRFLDDRNIEYIRISMERSSPRWNLFGEIESQHDIDEFARAMFPEAEGEENAFFKDTSRQVFAACLKLMILRNGGTDGLSNESVRRFFERRGTEEVYEELAGYPQFKAEASAIKVGASARQAQGVYASVQRIVNQVFVGDFGKAPKHGQGFSLREHAADPQGVPVVFDYPYASGQVTQPIFRFLIDHAAMLAMEDGETYSYFVLDEVAQIPHLRRLEELVNVGRGEKVVTLLTLQSVQQLRDNYGREGGDAILAGLVTMILLHPNDPETVTFYRDTIASEFKTYTHHVDRDSKSGTQRETKEVEEHPFSEAQIRRWEPGVGVIVTQKGWLHGYIPMLNDRTRAVIERVAGPDDEGGWSLPLVDTLVRPVSALVSATRNGGTTEQSSAEETDMTEDKPERAEASDTPNEKQV